MKIKTPFVPSFILLLFGISCTQEVIPTDPSYYVGRYTNCINTPECENAIQVNNRSTTPGANTGIIQSWPEKEELAHYEILGTVYHIYDWDSARNGSYVITDRGRYHFTLESGDGRIMYFEKYK